MGSHQAPETAPETAPEPQSIQEEYPATLREAIEQGYPPPVDEEGDLRKRYPEAFSPVTEMRATGATERIGRRSRLPELVGTHRFVQGRLETWRKTTVAQLRLEKARGIEFFTGENSEGGDEGTDDNDNMIS